MSLAERIRHFRSQAGLTLDELAVRADTSKGYLSELENDAEGKKKPSAEMLLRLANALSITLADLLDRPTLRVKDQKVTLTRSFLEFKDRMEKLGIVLDQKDLLELASMRFRGGQPRTVDEWYDLYSALDRVTRSKKHGEKSD
jgi:transcriptional regulator with XRE-family HTH domain